MFKCHFKFVYYTLAHYLYNICIHSDWGVLGVRYVSFLPYWQLHNYVTH